VTSAFSRVGGAVYTVTDDGIDKICDSTCALDDAEPEYPVRNRVYAGTGFLYRR